MTNSYTSSLEKLELNQKMKCYHLGEDNGLHQFLMQPKFPVALGDTSLGHHRLCQTCSAKHFEKQVFVPGYLH
jgi:hypothetical protein